VNIIAIATRSSRSVEDTDNKSCIDSCGDELNSSEIIIINVITLIKDVNRTSEIGF
tara:strand:- start:3716 stop:3883 length:168 start_codon:yes stop_codon:yes gene_type:complete